MAATILNPTSLEQAVFKHSLGNGRHKVVHLAVQVLGLAKARLTLGFIGQRVLARFEESRRSFVVVALGGTLKPTASLFEYHARRHSRATRIFILDAWSLRGLAADLSEVLFGQRVRPGCGSHLGSLSATMISKSPVVDAPQHVSGKLTGLL